MGELSAEQREWEAWLMYWPNPATRGKGNNRTAVPFDEWWGKLTGKGAGKCAPAEISDREMQQLISQGHVR